MPTAQLTPRSRSDRAVRPRRPSILDAHTDDPWIKRCPSANCLVLYLQALPIAMLAALPLDLVTLNHRLFELRQRSPRNRLMF